MKICLVTAFPPSRQGLNEYGFHIARELSQYPGLSLNILSDDLPTPEPELPGYNVTRCWAFDSLRNPVRLLRAIGRMRPDVVWFNLGFASFGGSPLPAFVGLAIPALTRISGYYTHVTLHQLVETVDLTDAGVKSQTLYKVAGTGEAQCTCARTEYCREGRNIPISRSAAILCIAFSRSASGEPTNGWSS